MRGNLLLSLGRAAMYAWTVPNTLVGVTAGTLILCFGGQARLVRGVFEFSGGRLGKLIGAFPPPIRFDAITFGHTILGVNDAALEVARDHEHVHVRQYERWGPVFLPAYVASSTWQLVKGRRVYLDNHFERQARAACKPTRLA